MSEVSVAEAENWCEEKIINAPVIKPESSASVGKHSTSTPSPRHKNTPLLN